MIYKIVLDSTDTTSFIGDKFNASYYIDFNKFITNQEDFDKPYKLYISITSCAAFPTESGFYTSNLFYYNLDFSKQSSHNYIFNNTRRPTTGVLRFDFDTTEHTGSATQLYIKVDDGPFYINNLRNVNNINFSVYYGESGSIFTGGSNDALSRYIIILTLEQIRN